MIYTVRALIVVDNKIYTRRGGTVIKMYTVSLWRLAGKNSTNLFRDKVNHRGAFLIKYIEHKNNLLGDKNYNQDSCKQIKVAAFGFSFHDAFKYSI